MVTTRLESYGQLLDSTMDRDVMTSLIRELTSFICNRDLEYVVREYVRGEYGVGSARYSSRLVAQAYKWFCLNKEEIRRIRNILEENRNAKCEDCCSCVRYVVVKALKWLVGDLGKERHCDVDVKGEPDEIIRNYVLCKSKKLRKEVEKIARRENKYSQCARFFLTGRGEPERCIVFREIGLSHSN